MHKRKNLAFVIGAIILFAIGLILTLILIRREQETRSRAQASSTLALYPNNNQVTLGDTVTFDIFLDPGVNKASFLKLELIFDPVFFQPIATAIPLGQPGSAFEINSQAFAEVIEGIRFGSGRATVSLGTGVDPNNVITAPVKVGALRLVATGSIPLTSGVIFPANTYVQFGQGTQILSTASSDEASENVLLNRIAASMIISDTAITPSPSILPCITPTPPQPYPNFYIANLTGSQEVPPVTTNATGLGSLTLQQDNTTAVVTILTCSSTLSSPITAIHIHGPANPGVDAGILVPLPNPVAAETITLTPQQVQYLQQGLLYFNVHTVNFPDGEIRGQIISSMPISSTPTNTPTPQPTSTPIPTPTFTPGRTYVQVNTFMHGIWPSGDNTNPQNLSANRTPINPQRSVEVAIYNPLSMTTPLYTAQGMITYDYGSGVFSGYIDLGTSLATGNYNVKIKSPRYLRRLIPNAQSITAGAQNSFTATTLIGGNVNNDGALNILDYNILRDCGYKSISPLPMADPGSAYNAPMCASHPERAFADVDDNGIIDQFDYNLFIRNLAVQNED